MTITHATDLLKHLENLKEKGALYWMISSAGGGSIRTSTSRTFQATTNVEEVEHIATIVGFMSSVSQGDTVFDRYRVSLYRFREHATMTFQLI